MGAAPRVRLLTQDDAPQLAELTRRNRDFLAPWEPIRGEAWFTDEGQAAAVRRVLDEQQRDLCWPGVILAEGEIVGRINLNSIVRGAGQYASVGYWVAGDHNGRGLATAAVAAVLELAWTELGLHRVEAGTLVHNVASQRVLTANGFGRIGLAPAYVRIAGRWQDHVLFQRLNPADDPTG